MNIFTSFTALLIVFSLNGVYIKGSDQEFSNDDVSGNLFEEGGTLLKSSYIFAPTSHKVSSKICRKHSLMFKKELMNHNLWALKSEYIQNTRT
ncbi:hypothetical protein C0J52_23711 [Blattella germanica]|nr:hypothetical protein C0J52_23711 [Blattella germanica]